MTPRSGLMSAPPYFNDIEPLLIETSLRTNFWPTENYALNILRDYTDFKLSPVSKTKQ